MTQPITDERQAMEKSTLIIVLLLLLTMKVSVLLLLIWSRPNRNTSR